MEGYTPVWTMCGDPAMYIKANEIPGDPFSEVVPQIALHDTFEKKANFQGSEKQ